MRRQFSGFILMAIVSVLIAAVIMLYIRASFFSSAYNVIIKSNVEYRSKYYIVVEAITDHSDGTTNTLICNKENYDKVNVGDMVFCELYHSSVLRQGYVHDIEPAI